MAYRILENRPNINAAFSYSVLAETVFAWPGIGRLVVDAIDQRDIPTVTGALVMTTMLVTVVNLLIDIVYAYVDPRIKAQYMK